MQSSSNVIKNTSVKDNGSKYIATDFIVVGETAEESAKRNIESYENLARTMLENARRQSDTILARAYEEAQNMEREAYAQGYETGRGQGYRDAYEQTMETASRQAEFIIENANKILKSAKLEYERYMLQKKEDILQLALNISEKILKKKLAEADGMNEMIFDILNASRNTETFIIRVNSTYTSELKEKTREWKERLALKGEIFVISDESVEQGNAVIEKNNGKVVVGLDVGMENVRQALM